MVPPRQSSSSEDDARSQGVAGFAVLRVNAGNSGI